MSAGIRKKQPVIHSPGRVGASGVQNRSLDMFFCFTAVLNLLAPQFSPL